MDLAASDAPVNPPSDDVTSVAEENGDGGEPVVEYLLTGKREPEVPPPPPAKKLRFGEEMNRVAEIVLVLSAMGMMRGGKSPTEVELELMSEARSKLAEMCQEFSPKDIVGRDAIGAMIEDLGLNGKLKDQRLGFRAPRLTICEKVSLGKRKMEEAKKYPTQSTGYSSHLPQPSSGTASPGLSTLGSATHTVRVIDRTNHQSLSSGVVTGSSPYVAVGSNVPMVHQWSSNEFKMSTTSVPTVGGHYVRDTTGLAQSKVERPQIKSEMLSGSSQGPATSSANYWNAPTWSAQPQPAFTVTTAADNKVPIPGNVRVSDQNFRPFMSQTPPGTFPGTNQPIQAMNFGQSSRFGNNHVEIAKIIHKVLHPRVQQNPSWNPPSREYMNKAMTCQICQATINEVETVLICDACEKGYHLKCLQSNNLKGVPKSEWHCSRCVQLYTGKSFPIKYGRVMRSANMQKMPSTTVGLQLPEKKVGMTDPKVNQPKPMVTTSPGIQNSPGFASGESNPLASVSHSETASVNGNTTATAAATVRVGSQGPIENFTSGSSAVPVSHSETANATTITTTSPMMNDGLVSKGPVPAGLQLPEKKVGMTDLKVNQPKPMVTTSPGIQNSPGFASGESNPLASVSHSETASVSANTTATAATTVRVGSQGPMENFTSGSSPIPVSHSETANATTTATTSPMMNNGLVSKGPVPAGTTGSISAVPVANLVPTNATPDATSNATPSASTNVSRGSQTPSVADTGDSSSPATGTTNETFL